MRFQHEFFAFLRKRLSLVQTFRWHETLRSTIEYTDNVYLSCLPCSRQLSRYSSHAANGKLASFSASSCWCGVIWIWRYQRHSTACDDTDDGRLLAFYDQFIKDYHCSQVPAHWCFYERTGEREVGYKRLMIVCRRSSASNDNTWCSEQLTWLCQRDAAPDRDSSSSRRHYSLYTENYTGDTETKTQNKTQIPRHFKVKF